MLCLFCRHRQIMTCEHNRSPEEVLAYKCELKSVPPKQHELNRISTPPLKKEHSSASTFAIEFVDSEREIPHDLFSVNKDTTVKGTTNC